MRLTYADAEIANRIIHHPEIFPMIGNDHTPTDCTTLGNDFLMNPTIWMLHPTEHALFMLTARTLTMYECHTMVEPEGRGLAAVKAAREAAKWFFENNETAEKIITYVPFYNKGAKVFALKVGFLHEGVCTKSI